MSSKYRALLNSGTNIENEEYLDRAKKHAYSLIGCLNKGSNWLQTETIKDLAYFTDFDFVKQALLKKHKETDSQSIKVLIKSIYENKYFNEEVENEILEKRKAALEQEPKEVLEKVTNEDIKYRAIRR